MKYNFAKKILISLAAGLFLAAFTLPAAAENAVPVPELTMKAQVLRVINQKEIVRENGSKALQQDIEIGILEGSRRGQKVISLGVGDIDNISSNIYNEGDKVIVSLNRDDAGRESWYIVDYVRTPVLAWLLVIFVVIVLAIGGLKGFMSLLSLTVSFFLIMKVFVPLVLKGYNPLATGIVIAFLILFAIIYLTEGWNRKAHVAVISILISLLITALLSWSFSEASRLTGMTQEETLFLVGTAAPLDFKNLLLAAMILGTLGVLDDVAVGQIETVTQIRRANRKLSDWKLFKMGMNVGQAHLGAIINTLFLAYAGASLPLVLLFSLNHEPFITVFQVLNNEQVATEIVRTLVGVIGLCLAVPIATFLAVRYAKSSDSETKNNSHENH